MKKLFSVVLLLILIKGTAHAAEINYFNKSWAEVKAKAMAEHKYIFIDCYTDWCGWCKVMDKETMTDPELITFMNDKFVAVKMDMEHGEGIEMSMKYHISGFPTFMFFTPSGEYVYQSVGYQKTREFMTELHNAMDKSKQFSARGYSATLNVDFPDFYKKIFAGNGKREFPKEEESVAFLEKQNDLFDEVSWGVIAKCKVNEKYDRFFLDNMAKYRSLYGPGSVNDHLNSMLNSKLQKAIKDSSAKELNTVLGLVDKYQTEEPVMTKLYFRVDFYKETKDWARCAAAVDDYISKKGYENAGYLNAISWSLYEKCADKKLLRKAGIWMKEVVGHEPSYAYLDTYAALLYKSGQMKDAEIWAGKAIDAGKKSGDDTSATEALLKKIKGGA